MLSRPNISQAKCVLVVGATSGIGRALALAIHDLPSKPTVIIAGRRQDRIDELTKRSDRFKGIKVDLLGGRAAIKAWADEVVAAYPDLDAIILSSGIQRPCDFKHPENIDLDAFEEELTTNFTSIITLIKFLMPHFLKLSDQGRPTFVIPISSGLGILPGFWVPTYSATKAAIHSFCLSLYTQLRDTNVHVSEIIPPLVESELHDFQGTTDKLRSKWMPLEEFTEQVMEGLLRGDIEITPGDVKLKWEHWEKGKIPAIAGKAFGTVNSED